jgi:hypothetical protein
MAMASDIGLVGNVLWDIPYLRSIRIIVEAAAVLVRDHCALGGAVDAAIGQAGGACTAIHLPSRSMHGSLMGRSENNSPPVPVKMVRHAARASPDSTQFEVNSYVCIRRTLIVSRGRHAETFAAGHARVEESGDGSGSGQR